MYLILWETPGNESVISSFHILLEKQPLCSGNLPSYFVQKPRVRMVKEKAFQEMRAPTWEQKGDHLCFTKSEKCVLFISASRSRKIFFFFLVCIEQPEEHLYDVLPLAETSFILIANFVRLLFTQFNFPRIRNWDAIKFALKKMSEKKEIRRRGFAKADTPVWVWGKERNNLGGITLVALQPKKSSVKSSGGPWGKVGLPFPAAPSQVIGTTGAWPLKMGWVMNFKTQQLGHRSVASLCWKGDRPILIYYPFQANTQLPSSLSFHRTP